MNDAQLPVARAAGLVIQELSGETLVYDLEIDKAHCLNQTAAWVWRWCDGKNSIDDITRLFGERSGGSIEKDLIRLALDGLNRSNLLENERLPVLSQQTRREAVKRIGLAAVVALPIITSLAAPSAAQAGSVCNSGASCSCAAVGGVNPTSCAPASASGCNVNCTSCGGTVGNQVCA